MTDNYDWNALAERAEPGRLAPVKGTALRGEEAARAGRTARQAVSVDAAQAGAGLSDLRT